MPYIAKRIDALDAKNNMRLDWLEESSQHRPHRHLFVQDPYDIEDVGEYDVLEATTSLEILLPHERELLQARLDGHTQSELAEQFGICQSAVSHRFRRIKTKLQHQTVVGRPPDRGTVLEALRGFWEWYSTRPYSKPNNTMRDAPGLLADWVCSTITQTARQHHYSYSVVRYAVRTAIRYLHETHSPLCPWIDQRWKNGARLLTCGTSGKTV